MPWRLPAEWEPQDHVWMVWPRDPLTWPDRLKQARGAYLDAVSAIAPQAVCLVVHPELEADVRNAVRGLEHVRIIPCMHQDSWIRDYGPLTLVDDAGASRRLKFRFDAWGGKYESLMADDQVVPRLVAMGAMDPVEEIGFVLEGGAVETDGRGTFLATQSVAQGRGQTTEEHEEALRGHLGAKKVIWLDEGIEGDDTDGHIDTITRFIAPGVVVTATAPAGHPDHAPLAHNLELLQSASDARGRPIEVIWLPVPRRQETTHGDPLPAGHANFLITDHALLVPTYGGPSDAEALEILASAFAHRRVVGIPHNDLIWGFGGIHCLSMQVARA